MPRGLLRNGPDTPWLLWQAGKSSSLVAGRVPFQKREAAITCWECLSRLRPSRWPGRPDLQQSPPEGSGRRRLPEVGLCSSPFPWDLERRTLFALLAGRFKCLPRAGPWSTWLERLLGILLIALSWYLVLPLLPAQVWFLGGCACCRRGGLPFLRRERNPRARIQTSASLLARMNLLT